MATERTRLGLLVGANTFRNPGLVAKTARRSTTSATAGRSSASAAPGSSSSTRPTASTSGRGFGQRLDWLDESVAAMRRAARRRVGDVRAGRPLRVRRPAPPAAPGPAAPADHDRRQRREEDAADGRPLRRHVERDGPGRRDGATRSTSCAATATTSGATSSEIEFTLGIKVTIRDSAGRGGAGLEGGDGAQPDAAGRRRRRRHVLERHAGAARRAARAVRRARLPDGHLRAAGAVRRRDARAASSARSSRWSTPRSAEPAARGRVGSRREHRVRFRDHARPARAPPRPSSSSHVTKRYDARREEHAGRRQRPLADRPGRQDLRPRRAVRLRQDDESSRWSTGSSSRRPAGSSSTARTSRRATSSSSGASIGYVIQQVGLFPHQTIGENVVTVPRLLGWPKERRRERAEELLAARRPRPGTYRDRYPSQLSRRRAPARRRRPGARRRPADHAHGRAVRRRRPDRPRAPPERVPAPPGGARQDDPVRDPRHRRGDQDGRPRRGHAGRRAASPSSRRRPRSWPARRRSSWPASSAPTAGSSACRSAASATSSSGRRRRPASATTPPRRGAGALADPFAYLLLVDEREPAARLDRPGRDPDRRAA